jgi:hypothetical protein
MTAAERRWWWRTGRGVGNLSSDGGLIGAVVAEPDIELGFIRGGRRGGVPSVEGFQGAVGDWRWAVGRDAALNVGGRRTVGNTEGGASGDDANHNEDGRLRTGREEDEM